MAAFRVLLVVDAEKFSVRRDAELHDHHLTIREVLDEALKASDLVQTWQAARFVENTGDGILAVLPAESAPRLVDHFPRCLQQKLAERARQPRAQGRRLRLRAALHVGIVDEYAVAPFSTAAIDVNRLLDAEPLHAALRDSDPDVTYAAFIVSARLFDTYVAGGWTRLRESQFTEVRVEAKQDMGSAYLHVPIASPGGAPAERDSPHQPAPVPDGPFLIGFGLRGNAPPRAIDDIVGRDSSRRRS
ncbi:MAG TPA: hypothetical protein VFU43_20640 [Streptosporangiaceae bacterium]|nr:hypothetical protein [Streptosporangiaceae bacterium]